MSPHQTFQIFGFDPNLLMEIAGNIQVLGMGSLVDSALVYITCGYFCESKPLGLLIKLASSICF